MILTDEEIQNIIAEGIIKYSRLGIPKQRQAIDRDIAKAQLKKVVEWLKTSAMIATRDNEVGITLIKSDWQALLKEIE